MKENELVAGIKEAAKFCEVCELTVRNRLAKKTFSEPILKNKHIYVWYRKDLLVWKLNKLENKLIKQGKLRKQ